MSDKRLKRQIIHYKTEYCESDNSCRLYRVRVLYILDHAERKLLN